VLFDGVDKIQHLCWRFIDPQMTGALSTEWELRVRDKCREYFSELDQRIGELLQIVGADATVFVASDHGFGPQVRTFFVNAWLRETGRLAWHDGAAPASQGASTLGLNQLARHVYQMDWMRTRAFAPLPSGNGIHIVREDSTHPQGVSAEDYSSFRDHLALELLEIRDPETGDAIVKRVWTREELFVGPLFELAPDLTLELTDGGLVSILDSPQVVRRRPQPTGTHRPDGVFAMAGPGVAKGVRLPPLSILDVAPLMLHALDLPIPSNFEGQFASQALDSAALAAQPPRYADDEVVEAPDVVPAMRDEEAEVEILKRLQALGYVD
jgi:predicted AlkP superfamily phosphohydrolase/phosphomutase